MSNENKKEIFQPSVLRLPTLGAGDTPLWEAPLTLSWNADVEITRGFRPLLSNGVA
jgi:hypothetical protein